MSRPRSSTLRAGLAGSVATLVLAPVLGAAPAFAQLAPATPNAATAPTYNSGFSAAAAPKAEQVEVTGSRLRTSNATSEAPITVVTSQQIEQSSAATIEDVLNKIPSIGSDGIQNTTNNGSNGASCRDLRNLGYTRTLILVDGRRFVHSGFGVGDDCVDLDTIPIEAVDRIELLKNGASTIYGADAVAGVINIITKKNYSGAQLNLEGNISASGDDRTGAIGGIFGRDFANGRGNITIDGRYTDTGPVAQKDRDWAVPAVSADNGPGQPYTIGSGYTTNGRFFGYGADTASDAANGINLNNDPSNITNVNGQTRTFRNTYLGANGGNPGAGGRYDYGYDTYLTKRLTDGSLNGSAHFDVNDHLTVYASTFYAHKNTQEVLSGQPITGNPNIGQSFDIPAGNPYNLANGFTGETYATRRTTDWGKREYNTGLDAWQATGGAKGQIIGNWDYDAYFTYGKSVATLEDTGNVQWSHLEQEMGFQALPGGGIDDGIYNPGVCVASTGCVLSNPYGAGNFGQQGINYATFTARSQAFYQFRDIGATITNKSLFKLPYGPVGLAVGMEHRGENGAYHPDPRFESGDSTAAIEFPTGGGFNVTEAFGELQIPILKNLVAAKDLSANVSGRWSDYNTFGSVQNWQAGINWAPTRDIRFRATEGTSIRQPAISEAFGGDTLSFNQAIDPCAAGQSYGGLNGVVTANCARQGINKATFQQPSTQVATLVGGNPNLQPEYSRTYTIGTVITPRWVPGLSMEIDYWRTKIENSIGTVSTQYVLDQCYTSANFSSPYCSQAGTRLANGQINNAQALDQNLGETRTNGIDFDFDYTIRLPHNQRVIISNELVDLIGFTEQQTTGGPFYNLKGRITPINTGLYPAGYPVISDVGTLTYAKGPFSFSWTMTYIDGLLYNDGSQDATPDANRFVRTNEYFKHDIEATYRLHKWQLTAGIDNLFDRTPPFVLDGSTNTAGQVYDVIGRLFYAKAQMRF